MVLHHQGDMASMPIKMLHVPDVHMVPIWAYCLYGEPTVGKRSNKVVLRSVRD